MSGHSKWANIKRQKAKVDERKGKVFSRLSKEIIAAARAGGGNPDGNMRLKTAIEKAKEANLPAENIKRAILKGTGELGGANYEELVYEGYGPGGTAVMLEIMTDNRNRTAGEIRYIFSRNGGNLGETGCVSWMFEKKGVITVEKAANKVSEEDLMMIAIEAGAEDLKDEGDVFEITTGPEEIEAVKAALAGVGISVESAEATMVPKNTVELTGEDAEKMLKLMDALEEHDDVSNVYANFDIPESEMDKI